MNHAAFEILLEAPTYIVLADRGPWDEHPTVTNDARWVIDQLELTRRRAPDECAVFYFDSSGRVDRMLHRAGAFTSFYHCTPTERALIRDLCAARGLAVPEEIPV